jgi:ribosome maturation factor RimP
MNYRESAEELKKIILPLLEEEGIVLVELRFMRTASGMILRLLADKKEGGISIEDCAGLNQKIGRLLDAQDIIKDRYILEVFSPGVDRDLVDKDDFSRCINRKVRMFLNECINAKTEIEGRIDKVEGELVYIDMGKEVYGIALPKIKKARQILGGI